MILRSAIFSKCGKYRHLLERMWMPAVDDPRPQFSKGFILWVMFNPSTADRDVDDATVRRCMAFSMREGFIKLKIVNLHDYIATDPAELLAQGINSRSHQYWERHVYPQMLAAEKTVFAWGAHATWGDAAGIHTHAVKYLEHRGRYKPVFYSLGVTNKGMPKHPLYLSKDTPLEVWSSKFLNHATP